MTLVTAEQLRSSAFYLIFFCYFFLLGHLTPNWSEIGLLDGQAISPYSGLGTNKEPF